LREGLAIRVDLLRLGVAVTIPPTSAAETTATAVSAAFSITAVLSKLLYTFSLGCPVTIAAASMMTLITMAVDIRFILRLAILCHSCVVLGSLLVGDY